MTVARGWLVRAKPGDVISDSQPPVMVISDEPPDQLTSSLERGVQRTLHRGDRLWRGQTSSPDRVILVPSRCGSLAKSTHGRTESRSSIKAGVMQGGSLMGTRWSRQVGCGFGMLLLLAVGGCSGGDATAQLAQPSESFLGATPSSEATPTAKEEVLGQSQPAAMIEVAKAGLANEDLPGGYHLVDELVGNGDAQPIQVYGTVAYDENKADPLRPRGGVIVLRLLSIPTGAGDTMAAPPAEVQAEARPDIAEGAVLYTRIDEPGSPSLTIPAGDYDIIIAATDADPETVLAFAKVVVR